MASGTYDIQGGSDVNTLSSSSLTNSSGDLILAIVSLKVNEADEIAISDTQTLTWTEVGTESANDTHNMRVWKANANGTATTVTVDSWTTSSDVAMSCVVVTSTDQTTPTEAKNHNNGNSKQISNTITTSASDSLLIIAHAGNQDEDTADLHPSGFTNRGRVVTAGTSSDRVVLDVLDKTASGGSDNHTWGNNTNFQTDRNCIAVEVGNGGAAPNTRRYSLTLTGVG